jgi:hypothetical protein
LINRCRRLLISLPSVVDIRGSPAKHGPSAQSASHPAALMIFLSAHVSRPVLASPVILWKYESNSPRPAMGVVEPPRGCSLVSANELGFMAVRTSKDCAGKATTHLSPGISNRPREPANTNGESSAIPIEKDLPRVVRSEDPPRGSRCFLKKNLGGSAGIGGQRDSRKSDPGSVQPRIWRDFAREPGRSSSQALFVWVPADLFLPYLPGN